ncbi:hypothetical protein A9264_01695 [Vibrio sp. UCD-FRSSP16_10]|uniref:hypothetical protein n=1 Tax=unclassified Vibrio TaxID=2614977 RepID=UPI0007FED392|nr:MULTISPECIES: hypothetical protein [unclassified Vibrio]OBT13879.1 hypothetical protein A9260_03145 [Vibrio sp. UCD-FRSSP16_30]OBT22760.1 hypothetical protein A9264_01695 [Vibrio sp. UCD-FRSSP16_10]
MTTHFFNQQSNTVSSDLTSDLRIQVTVGVGAAVIGFFTMAYPLISHALFVQILSIGFAIFAITLVVILAGCESTFKQTIAAKGFNGYATLTILLFLASYSMTFFANEALTFVAATAIAYFLFDELSTVVRVFRQNRIKCLALPCVDLVVTFVCLAMLISGLSVDGVFVVSAVLGLKIVLLGSTILLELSETKSHSFY